MDSIELPPYFTEEEELAIIRRHVAEAEIEKIANEYLLGYMDAKAAAEKVNEVIESPKDIKRRGTEFHDVLTAAYVDRILELRMWHTPPVPVKPIHRVYRD